jgi:hypothetical protein
MAEKKVQKRVPGYKSENQKYKSLLVMQPSSTVLWTLAHRRIFFFFAMFYAPFRPQKTKNPGCMSWGFSPK